MLGTLVALAVGAQRVATGGMTAAEVVQIAYLFSVLSFPVRAFGWVLGDLPRSVVLGGSGCRRSFAPKGDGVRRPRGASAGPARLDVEGVCSPTKSSTPPDARI